MELGLMDKNPTKLEHFDDMWRLESTATLLSHLKGDDGRHVLTLDRTIFYPQGGGQPADTGFVLIHGFDNNKFLVSDVRSKDGIVFHYGFFENLGGEFEPTLEKGKEVSLFVDQPRRKLNSRLHSAGHLLDICLPRIGLGNLEPSKAYHFPDGPWVEYKGTISQNEMQSKQKDLELEANALISMGGKVSVDILPYDEAAKLCGGCLPDYVPKVSL
ncbi:Alanyl-tRNA editing protein AlaX-L [Glycine soja]|uniref:Alanyl-tRNA editing protein AlaX-L n=1 Tax=Glycine soja TaxID=3848 RepID=A0A445K1B1_GLYSO|nr:Alanyl-tRNA editing protein AlaX-L [Glycine soja]